MGCAVVGLLQSRILNGTLPAGLDPAPESVTCLGCVSSMSLRWGAPTKFQALKSSAYIIFCPISNEPTSWCYTVKMGGVD